MGRKRQGTDAIPFKDILAGLMRERGLTLLAVANLAGVGKSVAQGWLSGATPHDLSAVARLAQALGVSFKSLLLGQTEDEGPSASLSALYEEVEFFDGLCRVSITKLVPRKKS
jgi:transcriptional regulator with XRE-family HTH domain